MTDGQGCYPASMASLDSVIQKLYRAKHHYLELEEELRAYYTAEETVQIRPAERGFDVGNVGAVPARFGLIAGDILQCMRSSLDYLVWELVLANGEQPGIQNAFPISWTVSNYKNEITNRKRLNGVDPGACALIDMLQPLCLPEAEREKSPLAVLDKLTNINKHRRVLLTNLKRVVIEGEPLPFPHILSDLKGTMPDGVKHTFVTFGFYVALGESVVSGSEIGTALNLFGDYIGNEVLPLFEKFFE
jgi:hypothetical protein